METEAGSQKVERRKFPRYRRVNFRARWSGKLAEQEATISEISLGGCFILSDTAVVEGELLRLEMTLPRGGSLTLWGHVIYRAEEIGFGFRFAPFLQQDDRQKLALLVKAEAHREKLRGEK